MNTLLPEPEPVISLAACGVNPSFSAAAPSPRPIAIELQARILLVDDEPAMRGFGKLVLARSGYTVDTAADGVEAWSALHEQEYDLLITDNDMPHLTGVELIRKACLERMNIPIILASGMFGACSIDDLPLFECSATLAKPYTSEELVSAVSEVLRAEVGLREFL